MSALRRLFPVLAAGGVALGTASCGSLDGRPNPPVLNIGERTFTGTELDRFIASRATFAGEPDAAVRSSLLDEFVREQLLLLAADEAGIEVPESRVVAEVAVLRRGPGLDAVLTETAGDTAAPLPSGSDAAAPFGEAVRLRDEVRARLRVEALIETVVLADLEVDEEAALAEYEADRGFYSRPDSVTLSELRFESLEAAGEAAEALAADAGSPLSDRFVGIGAFREWDLPGGVGESVFELEPGGITGVLETEAGYRIFRVDERDAAVPLSFEEAEPVVRLTALRREADARIEAFVEALRERHPVIVHTELLPFPYLGALADTP